MEINNISNLPIDVYKEIFFNYCDKKCQLNCLSVNKKIQDVISTILLSNLNIQLDKNLSPYSQLLKYYQSYCDFFHKKLPTSFELTTCKTVMEAKKIIEGKLSVGLPFKDRYVDGFPDQYPCSLLRESWTRFIEHVNPTSSGRLSTLPLEYQPEPNENYKDAPLLGFNEDIHMFLRAGARTSRLHKDVFGSIIKHKECTEETVRMLLAHKIPITADTLVAVIKSEKFKILLPDFIKNAEVNDHLLWNLCFHVASSDEHLIKEYVARVQKISCFTIRQAIASKYSENLISAMIEKCFEKVDNWIIGDALENKYSELLILDLLKKCSENLRAWELHTAIQGAYSEYMVEKILARVNENDKISSYLITASNRYSDDLVVSLMEKIDDVTGGLEALIKNKRQAKIIEKFLPQSEGHFRSDTCLAVVKNGYSENIFLEVFNRVEDQGQCSRRFYLGRIMGLYSLQTVELLLDKGADVITDHILTRNWMCHLKFIPSTCLLAKSIELCYPERIVDKILSKVDYVEIKDMQKAKLYYSPELVKKMQAKCK